MYVKRLASEQGFGSSPGREFLRWDRYAIKVIYQMGPMLLLIMYATVQCCSRVLGVPMLTHAMLDDK